MTPRVADRAYAAWLAADRDSMSDCHACELQRQGRWLAHRATTRRAADLAARAGRGDGLLRTSRAPSLASSLLPLLRLGRLDEARATTCAATGWCATESMMTRSPTTSSSAR